MNTNEQSNKKYVIISVEELHKVDFSVVEQTSQYTVRKSLDGSKTFFKWIGDSEPWFLYMLETKEGPYTYEEIVNILATEEWNSPYIRPSYINNENNFNKI